MNELDTFASLRPDVGALNSDDKATLRRDIFGATTGTQPLPPNQITIGRPRERQRPRWLLAAAASILLVVGAVVVWVATANRAGDAPTIARPISRPMDADQPAWYQTVGSLLPPGFDYIAIIPAPQNRDDGELYVVAAQPSSGLVLDVAIDTRAQSTDLVIEQDSFTDRWGTYLDNVNTTTLVTPDRRWIRVRCGITVIDGTNEGSTSVVALANDVCDAASGPTVTDRREVAARFADAADRGELSAVLDDGESIPTLPANQGFVDDTGRRELFEMSPASTEGHVTNVGMLYGVVPAAGESDPQVHRFSLDADSERTIAGNPELGAVDEIATLTFVRNGVLYQAVTTDTSDTSLATLNALVRRLADNNPWPPPPSTSVVATEPTAEVDVPSSTSTAPVPTSAATVPTVPPETTTSTPTTPVPTVPPETTTPTTATPVPTTGVPESGAFPTCTNDPYVWLASTDTGYQESAEIVQRRLVALGYDVGEVNGFLHTDTMAALEQWAADTNYNVNPGASDGFPRSWVPDFGMVDYPVLQLLDVVCDPTPSGCEFSMDLNQPLEYSDIGKRVQQRLAELGFDPGDIDGYFGPNSRAALEAWNRAGDKRIWFWTEGFDGFSITEKGWRDLGLTCSP